MARITLDSVWKYYGPLAAVKNLRLTCGDGEMLALLGPSGCGKSSTLKMIAGVEVVSKGEILFDDRPVSKLEPRERNIAMVFEDYALYSHLSVFENVAFPLRIRKVRERAIKERVDGTLDLLGLQALRHQNVKGLSGGAQQRVSIGRALVRDPELILFDEPLSHLDGDQKVQLRAEIKRLQKTAGLTAILVTHDQTEAIAMCDRVAVMNHGVLQQVDEPQTLYDRPANMFVADFIGEPPMNLLPVAVRQEGDAVVLDGGGWWVAIGEPAARLLNGAGPMGDVVLGIRPEHIDLAREPGGTASGALAGVVDWREMRGDSDVLTVDLRANGVTGARSPRVTLEVPASSSADMGEAVALRIRAERINLFDRATGANLLVRQ
jgi:ABC-type sugar transport system ATPase subunit